MVNTFTINMYRFVDEAHATVLNVLMRVASDELFAGHAGHGACHVSDALVQAV